MGGMVGVAQLVEHLVVVQDVAGSSPVTHPLKSDLLAGVVFIPLTSQYDRTVVTRQRSKR